MLDEKGHPGVAAARYLRDADDSTVADIQIAVIDAHQGVGLGTILLFLLAESAQENGITRFRARIHPENARARRLFERLGAEPRAEEGSLVGTVDLPLPEVRNGGR